MPITLIRLTYNALTAGFLIWALPTQGTPGIESIESHESIQLSPGGGFWGREPTVQTVYSQQVNRLIAVVENRDGNRVVRFDPITQGFSGGIPTAATGRLQAIQTLLSPDEKRLAILWSASFSGREEPVSVEIFNLDSFTPGDSRLLNANLQVIGVDWEQDVLFGIAEPVFPATAYAFTRIDLTTLEASEVRNTGVSRAQTRVNGGAILPASEELLVLYRPQGNPATAFVTFYDWNTGIERGRTVPFPGFFGTRSIALTPGNRTALLNPLSLGQGQIPVIDVDSLSLTFIDEEDLSPTFSSSGAAICVNEDTVWLGNSGDPAESIVVYNLATQMVERFIQGATFTTSLHFDPIGGTVYGTSFRLQSVYTIPSSATRPTAKIQISTRPESLGVDTNRALFQLLTESGEFYLVSEEGPNLVGLIQNLGANPQAGIVPDISTERILVGRSPSSTPLVLETDGYTVVGDLPVRAEVMAFDNSRNLIYTIGHRSATDETRVLTEIEGATFEILREIDPLSLSGANYSVFPIPTEMASDTTSSNLYVVVPPVLIPGRLIVFNTVTGATDEFSFGPLEFSQGNLFVDSPRARVLVTYTNGSANEAGIQVLTHTGVTQIEFSKKILFPHASILIDFAADPESDLLYYLTQNLDDWTVTVFDLRNDRVHSVHELPFLDSTNTAAIAFNSVTNRFGIFSSDGRFYVFDNPVDPTRRPPPHPPAVFEGSGQIGQTQAGIEIRWSLNPAGEAKEVFVDRRVAGSQHWIQLSTLPLPESLDFWTDTTPLPDVTYEYRVRAERGVLNASDTLTLGPVGLNTEEVSWLSTIPLVTLFMEPGETRETSFLHSLLSEAGLVGDVGATADQPLMVTVTPGFATIPGANTVHISCPTETTEGTYAVIVSITAESITARVPLLVNVVPEGTKPLPDTLFREPLTLSLSSDSDFSDRLLSIRGQLGLSRAFVKPEAVYVDARLPSGAKAERLVYAITGEFTADFPVPVTEEGDWTFEATLVGSIQTVGGQSPPFVIPVLLPDEKGTIPEVDLGQLVLASGKPPDPWDSTPMRALSEGIFSTLLDRRFKNEAVQLLRGSPDAPEGGIEPLTKAGLADAIGRAKSSRYVFLYIMGDAEMEGSTVKFILNDKSESVTAQELAGMLAGTDPLVIIDTPYAGAFMEALGQLSQGAFLFACKPDWADANYNKNQFTDQYLGEIRIGRGFGRSFNRPRTYLTTPRRLATNQVPQELNSELDAYYNLPVGSAFTPSRSLIRDRIPPRIEMISESREVQLGTTILLEGQAEDLPYDDPVSFHVDVIHPDGWVEKRELAWQEEMQSFTGETTVQLPGNTLLRFSATDGDGNQSFAFSSVTATEKPDALPWPEVLSRVLGRDRTRGEAPDHLQPVLIWLHDQWYSSP